MFLKGKSCFLHRGREISFQSFSIWWFILVFDLPDCNETDPVSRYDDSVKHLSWRRSPRKGQSLSCSVHIRRPPGIANLVTVTQERLSCHSCWYLWLGVRPRDSSAKQLLSYSSCLKQPSPQRHMVWFDNDGPFRLPFQEEPLPQ